MCINNKDKSPIYKVVVTASMQERK